MSPSGLTVLAFAVAFGATALLPRVTLAAGPNLVAAMPMSKPPPQQPPPTSTVKTPPPPTANPGCGDPRPQLSPAASGHR
jgi:hypothetical protein